MSFSFNTSNLANIERSLSVSRLDRYKQMAAGDLELALALHNWNTQLGSALHLPLQLFELTFRNCLHDSLAAKFGANWYDTKAGTLDVEAQSAVSAAKDKLINQGRRVLPPPVIAQLSFGFWLNLLKRRYETPFWIPAIKNGFTHAPLPIMRQTTFDAVDKIRYLRNRIFHHEPVHHRNLKQDLAHIVDVAGWICPDTAAWIAHCGAELDRVILARPK